jgi:hypothetical protein
MEGWNGFTERWLHTFLQTLVCWVYLAIQLSPSEVKLPRLTFLILFSSSNLAGVTSSGELNLWPKISENLLSISGYGE